MRLEPYTRNKQTSHMRTKSLLLAAAVGLAGALSASAQSTNVYSVNAVGYVQVNLPAGYSLISNPLNGTNNALNTIIPNAPDNAFIFRFNSISQTFDSTVPQYFLGFGWFPNSTINPGEGFFINVSTPTNITFVGEVPQGSLTNSIPVGYSMRSSIVPKGGSFDAIGFPAGDNDTVISFNSATQSYSPTVPQYFNGVGWFPAAPTNQVGGAFFIVKSSGTNWVSTFSASN